MKNIAFHSNQLGIRGTEVALYDYAVHNETILKNKSYIISNKNGDLTTLKKFQEKFDVFLYEDFEECKLFVEKHNITHVYYIKAGDDDGKILPNVKNLIHAVFQNKDIHGDVYAYVSEWLANKMNEPNKYVPHIVWLPEPNANYKEKLNIPKENIVIGRHGGYEDFDLPFVHRAINKILNLRPDITFLFMNTKPFCSEHPNIIHINKTYNTQNKANFINTCDYMIHARNHGESFGLAICEFLFNDKPIISWKNGLDLNHLNILKDKGIYYQNEQELNNILANLNKNNQPIGFYKKLVENFTPLKVMEQFQRIFLLD